MNEIASQVGAAIDAAKGENRAALIAYLPVGYPSLAGSIDAVLTLIDAGVDVIELGPPYSDPIMDGPVIQEAVVAALAQGIRLDDTFAAVEATSGHGAPILVMSYYNPIFHRGVESYAASLAQAGGAGLVTPDLIPDEAGEWIEASDRHGLDRVFLVAPTSSPERLALTAAACRGFTYATSTMGVTGERGSLNIHASELVGRARLAGAERVCVGIGVSNAEQARTVASFADGVIVGSAFVRKLLQASSPSVGLKQLANLAEELVQAVRPGRPG